MTDSKKLAITPISVTHPERVAIDEIRLFREPAWVLRLTIEGALVAAKFVWLG